MEPTHTKDSDCTVDPETLLCSVCGVDHSDSCPECSGRGFHAEGCSRSDVTKTLSCGGCNRCMECVEAGERQLREAD